MHINALCSPVFQLVLPFKIELSISVLKELIDRLNGTFIASRMSTTKLGFQFRKQVEVRGGEFVNSAEKMGDGEEFKSRSQSQHPSQLKTCELAHCRAGAERLESVCPSFYA
jgi:hypothetical protein